MNIEASENQTALFHVNIQVFNSAAFLNMSKFIFTWLICIVVFFVIDFIWLGTVAKTFYRTQIGHLLAPQFNIVAAFLFYVIYVAGIVWFCVHNSGDWKTALVTGALFGFFCYATYDMTNYATLRDWPLKMVLVDIAWGTALTGAVAGAGKYLSSYLSASGGA